MLKIGNIEISALYIGNTECLKAYLGTTIVYEKNQKPEPLHFTALQNSTIELKNFGDNTPNIEYSSDNGTTWNTWNYNTISLNTNDTILMRGSNPNGFSKSDSIASKFNLTGQIAVSGNIMSLINYNQKIDTIPCDYCFIGLFANNSSLTAAPELPATTLTEGCYSGMFYGCSTISIAPELPATNIAPRCYEYIFANCSNLSSIPSILPATTLYEACYTCMFTNCINLIKAPYLPATILVESCYAAMFWGCSNLNYIYCNALDISATDCTTDWVMSVAPIGTFIKNSNMFNWLIDSVNGIPIGWTLKNNTDWIEIERFTTIETNITHTLNIDGFSELGFFVVGGGGSGKGDFNLVGHSGNGGNGGQVKSFTTTISNNLNLCIVTVGAGGSIGLSQSESNSGLSSQITYNGNSYSADGGYGGSNSLGQNNIKQEFSGIGGKYPLWLGGISIQEATDAYNWFSLHTSLEGPEKIHNINFYGSKGEDGLSNPFDTSDTNLYGAGGAGGLDAYNVNTNFPSIDGGQTNGGAGGCEPDNNQNNAGQDGGFYGAGGGGAAFSSNHTYSTGGAGHSGIIIVYATNT